eukprot:jgi/Hompol1/2482/HPOL_006012-RA
MHSHHLPSTSASSNSSPISIPSNIDNITYTHLAPYHQPHDLDLPTRPLPTVDQPHTRQMVHHYQAAAPMLGQAPIEMHGQKLQRVPSAHDRWYQMALTEQYDGMSTGNGSHNKVSLAVPRIGSIPARNTGLRMPQPSYSATNPASSPILVKQEPESAADAVHHLAPQQASSTMTRSYVLNIASLIDSMDQDEDEHPASPSDTAAFNQNDERKVISLPKSSILSSTPPDSAHLQDPTLLEPRSFLPLSTSHVHVNRDPSAGHFSASTSVSTQLSSKSKQSRISQPSRHEDQSEIEAIQSRQQQLKREQMRQHMLEQQRVQQERQKQQLQQVKQMQKMQQIQGIQNLQPPVISSQASWSTSQARSQSQAQSQAQAQSQSQQRKRLKTDRPETDSDASTVDDTSEKSIHEHDHEHDHEHEHESDQEHPFGSRRFPCSQCKKSFTRKYNLDAHILSHQNIKPFECTESGCKESFVRKYDLQRHVQTVHNRNMFGPCPYCSLMYSRADSYRKHLRLEEETVKTGRPMRRVIRNQKGS